MNITETKQVLPILFRNNVVPYLHGSQGVGKTAVVKQVASQLGYNFVHLHLATQEVGDLVGLLSRNSDGTVAHCRPSWFPTEGKGIIFLDEFNRAQPEVLQCMFSFITEKKIHSHTLPEGWVIAVAGNYDSNKFTVTSTSDAALLSRFCHIDFKPTVAEFVSYAKNERSAYSVANFISESSGALEVSDKEGSSLLKKIVEPDRRAWLDFIAPLENEEGLGDSRFEVYAGLIGEEASAAFLSWKKVQHEKLSLEEILKNKPNTDKKVAKLIEKGRLDTLNGVVEELKEQIARNAEFLNTPQKVEALKKFLLAVPAELALKTFRVFSELSCFDGRNEIMNDADLIRYVFNAKVPNNVK